MYPISSTKAEKKRRLPFSTIIMYVCSNLKQRIDLIMFVMVFVNQLLTINIKVNSNNGFRNLEETNNNRVPYEWH